MRDLQTHLANAKNPSVRLKTRYDFLRDASRQTHRSGSDQARLRGGGEGGGLSKLLPNCSGWTKEFAGRITANGAERDSSWRGIISVRHFKEPWALLGITGFLFSESLSLAWEILQQRWHGLSPLNVS